MHLNQAKQHALFYAFLPYKSRTTYEKLFHIIQEKAQNLQLQFDPETVIADFELAIKHAGDYEKNSRPWSTNPIQRKYVSTKVICM